MESRDKRWKYVTPVSVSLAWRYSIRKELLYAQSRSYYPIDHELSYKGEVTLACGWEREHRGDNTVQACDIASVKGCTWLTYVSCLFSGQRGLVVLLVTWKGRIKLIDCILRTSCTTSISRHQILACKCPDKPLNSISFQTYEIIAGHV